MRQHERITIDHLQLVGSSRDFDERFAARDEEAPRRQQGDLLAIRRPHRRVVVAHLQASRFAGEFRRLPVVVFFRVLKFEIRIQGRPIDYQNIPLFQLVNKVSQQRIIYTSVLARLFSLSANCFVFVKERKTQNFSFKCASQHMKKRWVTGSHADESKKSTTATANDEFLNDSRFAFFFFFRQRLPRCWPKRWRPQSTASGYVRMEQRASLVNQSTLERPKKVKRRPTNQVDSCVCDNRPFVAHSLIAAAKPPALLRAKNVRFGFSLWIALRDSQKSLSEKHSSATRVVG